MQWRANICSNDTMDGVKQLFNKHRDRLIREFGRGALNSSQVDEIGRREFGRRWGGVSDQATWVPRNNRFFILNTARTPNSPGYHWVGVYVSPAGVPTAYDSFGRNVHKLMYTANGMAKKRLGHALQGTDPKAEQKGDSQICGCLSVAFLCLVRDVGVRAAAAVV
jgi:hypothetical protein